jgi:hypothetical protein
MTRLMILGALLGLVTSFAFAEPVSLEKLKEIPLPGGAFFDYLSVDAASRRLFVAHSPRIEVFDLDKVEKVGEVTGIEGAHGALIVPVLKRGFATAGKKDRLIVFDPSSYKVITEIPTGNGPDAVLYVSTIKEVWTMNHKAGTITCVDGATLATKATIPVGGKLEFAVEWAARGLVFVNVEDRHQVVCLDAKKHQLVAVYPLAPGQEPTGMALDDKAGVLFCGCASLMVMVDAAIGRVISTVPITEHCDAVAFDAERRLAFASCGDGFATIVHEESARSFQTVGKINTAKGGRTCTFDPGTRRLWVAAGTRGKDDVRLLVFGPVAKK